MLYQYLLGFLIQVLSG